MKKVECTDCGVITTIADDGTICPLCGGSNITEL